MVDRQQANEDWLVAEPDGRVLTWERAAVAVLMDIRRELRRLNAAMYCPNFLGVPRSLRQIARNTGKRKARRPKR